MSLGESTHRGGASSADADECVSRLHRDGYALVRGVLSSADIEALREAVDRVFEEPRFQRNRYHEFIAVRLFETAEIFEELLTREPLISLVESVLGDDCHIIAQNVLRNTSAHRLADFHVDDLLIFPSGDEMPRHDPRMQIPVHVLGVQIPLTDLESIEYGPSQYVPGSHASGKRPNDPLEPEFEGRGPDTVLCRAGDIYLHNGQCWHRGLPNRSDRTRYLFQQTYARRWVSQRFHPFVNYQIPRHVLERADARRRRVLGLHPMGDYG